MSNLVVKVRRETIAACMTCPLCHKLFRDATTISECLHTFCRKCIYKKLQDEETDCCPICNIDLGCFPVEKLRADHNFQDVRAKIKRQKVKAPEIVPSVTLPVRRKERSLSSLVVSTPRVSTHSGMTGRRSKIARKSLRGSSFSIEKPIKNEEGSSEDQPESSCSPETLNKFTIGKEVEGSGVKAHPPSGSAKPPARRTRVRLHLNNPRSTEAWAGMDNNSNVLLLAKSIRNAFNPQMFSQLEPTDKWERHMMEKFRAITAATVIMEEEDELCREMVNLNNTVQELESKNAPLEAELKIAESSLSANLSDPCLVELDAVPKEIISLRRTIAGLQEENLKLKNQVGESSESSGARKQAWMDESGFLPEVLARFSVDPSTVDQFLQSLGEVPAFNERLVDDRNRTHHRGMRDFQMHLYGYLDKFVKIPDYRDVWDLPAILVLE